MRHAALALTIVVFFFIGEPASAAEPGDATRNLLLEVWINGRDQSLVVPVTERNGILLISKNELDEIGIRCTRQEADTDGLVNVGALSGVAANLDEANQTLMLQAETRRLLPQIIDLRPAAAAFHRAEAGTGLIVDYDGIVTAADPDNTISGGITLQATGFSPWGALTATGFGTTASGESQFTRLDTALEVDDQEALRQWVVGDAISGGLNWSRSVRFAGLHVATDYSLEPELVTQPLPQFFGQTTVPASVDVFVNAAKVLEMPVKPGPFEIRNLPVITGGGTAQIVVRDELGREVTQSVPFYTTPRLLTRGFTDYSFDVGALRDSYGVSSFDYGDPVAEATLRYGLNDRLTLEGHGETSTGVLMGGAGAIFSVPPIGIVETSIAGSHAAAGAGDLAAVTMQSQTHPINLFASYTATSEHYADVGSIDAAPPPRERLQTGLGLSLGPRGSLALSWIDIHNRSGVPTQLATASYSFSLGGGLFFGVTGVRDIENGTLSTEAFLSIPLGGGTNLGSSVRRASGANSETLSLTRPADPDGGLGYRVLTTAGSQDMQEANVSWIEKHGRLDGSVSSVGGQTAARVGASGALVVMDGSLFATETSDDAFALVRTGEPNIDVYRENRPVARSNASGEVLVPNLNAYESNHISVEPRDYPMNVVVSNPEKIVVPRRRSGQVVDFSPPRQHPAQVIVKLADGGFPPAGTRVLMEGRREPLVIGHRGKLFIADLATKMTGRIPLQTAWCVFDVAPAHDESANGEIPLLGPVICRLEAASAP